MTGDNKSLTAEQIEVNKVIILKFLSRVGRTGMAELIAYIQTTDFFMAPASTKYHCSYEGGLAEHSLNVLKRLAAKKDTVQIEQESMILCALLHDLCKANVYTRIKKNVKDGMTVKNGKQVPNWIEVDAWDYDDKIPLGHGEKSVMMINIFVPLSMIELAMIRWHQGPEKQGDFDTFYKACAVWPEVVAMHNADMEATYILEAAKPELICQPESA